MTVGFLLPVYPWVKALHVVSFIAWMAGMLYLPRLFVYHCETAIGSESSERFKVMERRLYTQITVPAMAATYLFGITLVLTPGVVDWHSGWWHLKLLSVVALAGFTGMMGGWRRGFLHDRNRRPGKFFRYMNEVPTLLMVLAVLMVVAKPF